MEHRHYPFSSLTESIKAIRFYVANDEACQKSACFLGDNL